MAYQFSDNLGISDDVVTRRVGNETMLLDLDSGTYHGLDAVGGRFWELVEEHGSLQGARDAMLNEFEVEPQVLDRDLIALITDLAAKRLLVES